MIAEDSNQAVWICGAEGVVTFDGENWMQHIEPLRETHAGILSVYFMKNGDIWFGGETNGLTVYNGQSWTRFDVAELLGGNYLPYNNMILSIVETPDGLVWLNTGNWPVVYDGNSWDAFFNKYDFYPSMYDMEKDYAEGTVWLGTMNGLLRYDHNSMDIEEQKKTISGIKNIAVYPNPSNQTISVTFHTKKPGYTSYEIFNILGQKVKQVNLGRCDAGKYTFTWNGVDGDSNLVESGVYILSLRQDENVATVKFLFLK